MTSKIHSEFNWPLRVLLHQITFSGLKTVSRFISDSIDDFFFNNLCFLFSGDYGVAKNVAFESKMETDLYEFVKCKTFITSMSLSPDGKFFATWVRKRTKGLCSKIARLQLCNLANFQLYFQFWQFPICSIFNFGNSNFASFQFLQFTNLKFFNLLQFSISAIFNFGNFQFWQLSILAAFNFGNFQF